MNTQPTLWNADPMKRRSFKRSEPKGRVAVVCMTLLSRVVRSWLILLTLAPVLPAACRRPVAEAPSSSSPPLPPATAPVRRTILGQIMDSTCLAEGKEPSPEHASCAIRCIRGGAPVAIIEDGTQEVFIALASEGKLVNQLMLPHVGRRTEVTGTVVRRRGSQFLVVESVASEHEHSPHQGGAVAMAGDLHLEAVALRTGEVRVFLSDRFRKPLSAAGRKGQIEVRQTGGAARAGDSGVRTAPLLPDEAGKHLAARVAALSAEEAEVTVRLPLQGDAGYFVTFMLQPRDEGAARARAPGGAHGGAHGHHDDGHDHDAPAGAAAAVAEPVAAVASKGVQHARILVQGGYAPDQIILKKGVPARLRFVRKESSHCSSQLKIPAFGIDQKLTPLGETVVALAPDRSGEFPFSCGMDMLRGRIIVRE